MNKQAKKILKAMKDLQKSQKRLKIAKYRRIKAQEGKIFSALFGKP